METTRTEFGYEIKANGKTWIVTKETTRGRNLMTGRACAVVSWKIGFENDCGGVDCVTEKGSLSAAKSFISHYAEGK